MSYYRDFSELTGKTLKEISVSNYDDTITFVTVDGEEYRLYHSQDCCETVKIEDIAGDLDDLIGSPILMAEEVSSRDDPNDKPYEYAESWTWTFYKISTIQGSVTIRWLGTSNGYYSEGVDFVRVGEA